jgi:hypothetical protein
MVLFKNLVHCDVIQCDVIYSTCISTKVEYLGKEESYKFSI